jgi:hypothetical protein
MLVPITLLILTLVVALAIGLYTTKRRVVDHEEPPDIRPDDPRPPTGPHGPSYGTRRGGDESERPVRQV